MHEGQHGDREIPKLVFVKFSDCWYLIEKGWYWDSGVEGKNPRAEA